MQFLSHECRVLVFMGRNEDSIARGFEALTLIGLELSIFVENPSLVSSYESEMLESIDAKTSEGGILETFQRLPTLTDKFITASHSIIVEMIAPLALSTPHMLHTLPLVGSVLTLEYGKSVHSAFYVKFTHSTSNK